MTWTRRQTGSLTHRLELGVFLWCLSHVTLLAEPRALSDTQKAPPPPPKIRRYEMLTDQSFPIKPGAPLLPERVYVVYEEGLKAWIYSVTDTDGKLASPRQGLAPGTVLPGAHLGGDPKLRYRLTAPNKWKVTKLPVQRRAWLIKNYPEYRIAIPFQERYPAKAP
jgi:hypothetical protein